MRIEDNAIAVNESLTDGMNPIQHWAFVRTMLRRERDRVLKAHGLTERTYYELETHAIRAMDTDEVQTEFGLVKKKFQFVDPTDPESAKSVTGLELTKGEKSWQTSMI